MRMKVNGNYASSSDSVPEFDLSDYDLIEHQTKKRSSPKIEGILSRKSSEDQKKVFSLIWY